MLSGRVYILFYWSIIAFNVYHFLLYNEVNQLYVYLYPFALGPPSHHPSPIPPIWVIREHQAELLVLYSSFTLTIYFTHSSVYMSIHLSQFLSLSLSLFESTCPFSMSVSLSLCPANRLICSKLLKHMKRYLTQPNNKCWRECDEKGTLLHCWWECKLVQPLWRTVWRFLKKTGNRNAIWPSNPTAGHTH